MASATQKRLFLTVFVAPARGGGPVAPTRVSQRRPLHLCPFPWEAPAAAGPGLDPRSDLGDFWAPHPARGSRGDGIPWPSPDPAAVPPQACPGESRSPPPQSLPVPSRSPRQTPRGEHSPSCPARPARLRLGLRLAAGGAGVAVRPGRGAERGPLPLSARPAGSPRPRPHRLPRPRRPAAAAATATARRRHVTGPRGSCGPRDPAMREGRSSRPLPGGSGGPCCVAGAPQVASRSTDTREGCASPLLPGAPRSPGTWSGAAAAARPAGSLGIPRSPPRWPCGRPGPGRQNDGAALSLTPGSGQQVQGGVCPARLEVWV